LNLLLFNYLPLQFLVSLSSACSSLKAWCSVNIDSTEQFLKSGKWPQLTVYSTGPRPAGVRQQAVIRAASPQLLHLVNCDLIEQLKIAEFR
jgi:hypothetical protein